MDFIARRTRSHPSDKKTRTMVLLACLPLAEASLAGFCFREGTSGVPRERRSAFPDCLTPALTVPYQFLTSETRGHAHSGRRGTGGTHEIPERQNKASFSSPRRQWEIATTNHCQMPLAISVLIRCGCAAASTLAHTRANKTRHGAECNAPVPSSGRGGGVLHLVARIASRVPPNSAATSNWLCGRSTMVVTTVRVETDSWSAARPTIRQPEKNDSACPPRLTTAVIGCPRWHRGTAIVSRTPRRQRESETAARLDLSRRRSLFLGPGRHGWGALAWSVCCATLAE